MLNWFNTRTAERAIAQVELRNVVAELADVARQREAGLVAAEANHASLRLHADELERELACAHRDSLLNSLLVYVWYNKRLQHKNLAACCSRG